MSRTLGMLIAGGVLLLAILVLLFAMSGGTPPADSPPAESAPVADAGAPAVERPVAPTESEHSPPSPPPVATEAPVAQPSPLNLTLSDEEATDVRRKLKQIALGMLNFESARRSFPPGPLRQGQVAHLSWRVYILPYLGQEPLYRRFKLDQPWDSPHNKALIDFMPDVYRTGQEPGTNTRFVVYSGENTLFKPGRAATFSQCRDGTSNTLLAVHTGAGKNVPWTKPEDVLFIAVAPLKEVGAVNGRFEGILVDGSPLSLPPEVDEPTIAKLVTPAGDEIVDGAGLSRRYSPARPSGSEAAGGPNSIARQTSAGMNRLKTVSLAMLNHHDARKMFPPAAAYRVKQGLRTPEVSWRVNLLPFMEQQNLYRSYQLDQPWDSDANQALLPHMPGEYRHETTPEGAQTRLQVFVGEGTPFGPPPSPSNRQDTIARGPQLRQLVDGSSNTIMTIESGGDRAVNWMEPRDVAFNPDAPLEALGQLNEPGALAGMFDGSVRVITTDVDPEVFKSLVLTNDQSRANRVARSRSGPAEARRADPAAEVPPGADAPPAVVAASADVVKLHKLPRPGFRFAFDPATNRLMVAEFDQNQVSLYEVGETLRPIATIPSPAKPTVVIAKRFQGKSYFIVGGALDKRIDVLNAEDGQRTSSVHIQTPTINHLAASQRDDDPFVYYASSNGGSGERYMGRFNLANSTDEGFVAEGGSFELAPDGGLMYHSGRNSPNHASYRVAKGAPYSSQEMKTADVHLERAFPAEDPVVGDYIPSPDNLFVAIDNTLRDYWLEDIVGRFDFPILAFYPGTPWALGISDETLRVASVNDLRTAAEVPLPPGFNFAEILKALADDPERYRFTEQSRVTPIYADAPRKRVIIAANDQVAVVPLDALKLPAEPLVAVACQSSTILDVDQPMALPFAPFDPRLTVNLASAPRGMTLKDGKLHWQPTGRDIGYTRLLVETKFDRFRREQAIQFEVRRLSLDVPVKNGQISLSADGALAVVWGDPLTDESRQSNAPALPNLFVIDVPAKKIRAQRVIEKGVVLARIDGQGVYVLTAAQGDAVVDVLQLSLNELKLIRTVGAKGAPILDLVPGKYLLAGADRFKLPDLEKLPPFGAVFTNHQGFEQARHGAIQLEDGWNFDGVIWNADASKAVMLLDPQGFLGSTPLSVHSGHQQGFRQDPSRVMTGWGRLAGESLLYGPSQSYLESGGRERRGLLVPPGIPAAIALEGEQSQSNGFTLSIRVYELQRGSETQTIVLHRLPGDHRHSSGNHPGQPIDAAGDTLAAISDGRLYVMPLSAINRDHLAPPLRIKLAQNPLVLAARGEASLKYAILDGEAPYELKFSILGNETRTSGQQSISVPLDLEDLAARLLSNIRNWQWPDQQRGPDGQPKDPRISVVDYVDSVTPAFRELTGRVPRGVPLVLPVFVEATDRNLEIAQLYHAYLIEIPATTVVKTLTDEAAGRLQPYVPRPLASRVVEQPDRDKRLAELDQQLATSYSDEIREKNPHAKINDDQLQRRAKRSRNAADALLNRALTEFAASRTQRMRTWKDKKGHATLATLKSAFADQVVLSLASGNEVTVPLNKLSDEDLKFIDASIKPAALSPTHRQVVQMRLVLAAIQKHAGRTGGYPPAYIVDQHGNPTLSWRVAILPDLGAQDMFRMFHFDESWDSEHNRKLLAHMPAVFRMTEQEAADVDTTLLALRAPNGVFASPQSLTRREITARQESPLVLAEAIARFASPWTQPTDIDSSQFGQLDDVLKSRQGRYLVGNVDGALLAAPAGTPEAAWRKAVSRDDRTLSQIEFEDPMSLAVEPPAEAP